MSRQFTVPRKEYVPIGLQSPCPKLIITRDRYWLMPRPIHFNLAVGNPERAMSFYRDIFGWKFEKWTGPIEYWMVTTADEKEPGINGCLSKRSESGMPNMNTMGYLQLTNSPRWSKMKGARS